MRDAHDLVSIWPALDIAGKRSRLRHSLQVFAGPLAARLDADRDVAGTAAAALWRRDPSLWSRDHATQQAIANRLGWLSAPALMADEVERLQAFAANVRRDGFTHVVLLGMGGSSLAPEVLRAVVGVADGWPSFRMLDSTDPEAIRAAATPPERTLYLLASKSGTTIEPNSLAAHFRERLAQRVPQWAEHFVAITDEGTPLARRARDERFREVFINPADIGGRYSAISYFGLVPAALMGQDVGGLIAWSLAMLSASDPEESPAETNPAVALGLAIGASAGAGRDKLTLLLPSTLLPFGLWVEQLVAESTGKHGVGVVPIAGETPALALCHATDRLFVRLTLAGAPHDEHDSLADALKAAGAPVVHIDVPEPPALGGEFVRWEIATAVAGAMLHINPFDEPNVQQAKDATRTLLLAYESTGRVPRPAADRTLPNGVSLSLTGAARKELGGRDPEAILALVQPPGYFALLAYLGPDRDSAAALQAFRDAVRDRTGAATMFGYGPRYLHSTGQLHKGGPNTGVFVLLTADPIDDLPIPGQAFSFGTLELAQALGDFASLDTTARRALHVHLPRHDPRLVRQVAGALLERIPQQSLYRGTQNP